AALRAVAEVPSAPTARQLAYRFRPSHIRAIERAQARVGNALDRKLGRDPGEQVTFDLDATESVVYGRRKRGSGRSRSGQLAYNSYVVTWAQRGRALTSDLKGGNQARIKATQSLTMIGRAGRLLPAGHGRVTVRGDSGFYAVELMMGLRKRRMRFTLSATRTATMWAKLAEIPTDAWVEAIDMRGAQVAELPFSPEGWAHEPLRLIVRRVPITAQELLAGSPKARRRKTIPPQQLQMVLDGELDSTFAYSFIVSDIPAEEKPAAAVEHFHRQRAQIEERFKDLKLGQALRHLPSGKLAANRLWLCCALLALNLCAWVCDISPAAAASGSAPEDTPLRRHAKMLRRLLFCVPGRIVRSARQIIVRLPERFPHFEIFNATYHAALALPDP
ncbi:MAG: IS1380 family transposase, partial [Actinobacteria bacterium]|nr:IS1380 family transposase [Actinomycetota bacterium]